MNENLSVWGVPFSLVLFAISTATAVAPKFQCMLIVSNYAAFSLFLVTDFSVDSIWLGTRFVWFQFSYTCWSLFCDLGHDLSWFPFHGHLKRKTVGCTAICWTILSVSVNWILLQLVASLSSHTSLPVLCVVLPVCEWIFQSQLWLICDSCSLPLVVPHMPCTSVWCVLSVWPIYRKLCPSVSLIISFAMTVIKALLRQCNVTSLCLWLWCYNIFGIVPLSS